MRMHVTIELPLAPAPFDFPSHNFGLTVKAVYFNPDTDNYEYNMRELALDFFKLMEQACPVAFFDKLKECFAAEG